MSNYKIEEIRARHERVQQDGDLATPPVSMAGQNAAVDAHDDRNTLLSEIDRLRAENEMLIVAVTMIERMAAGAIYSQESIHAAAIGVLKQLEGKP